MLDQEKIVVLDFGGQYNLLVARRVREAGVYCEILPHDVSLDKINAGNLKGIIFTGGPDSVNNAKAKSCAAEVFTLGVPVLGICYGMQLLTRAMGGDVSTVDIAEFGYATAEFVEHPLFAGVTSPGTVWMSHRDTVTSLPAGFKSIAKTDNCAYAALANDDKKLYGVQFHPEVKHTNHGQDIIVNFLTKICGCSCTWRMEDLANALVEDIKKQVGDSRIISALSGGVDSSVASVLAHRAVGNRLTCIFVDHGLLRQGEVEEVMGFYRDQLGLDIVMVDAKERFLARLAGVVEPEQKRRIIGEEFIRVFEEKANELGGADYMVQGTIYPDVIESGMGKADTIKSHHNVGGLPENIDFRGLVEPLRMLFKDEVRVLGEKIGIPPEMLWRQPFPGPGLAIRIIGEVTEEKLTILRHSDYILREEIKFAGLTASIWQYFTVFTGIRTVGVKGDCRTYDYTIGVRAVSSDDAMTAEFSQIPYDVLRKISSRIINEVKHVNRVVYDITTKPPGTIEWE